MKIFKIIFSLLFVLGFQNIQAETVTLQLNNMTPHIGQRFQARVVDRTNNIELDRVTISTIATANFSITLNGIAVGGNYNVDFYADHNGNGRYDAPPADHAWRLVINGATGNETLTFEHNTLFTSVLWPMRFTLNLSNMTPHLGQRFALRVVNKTTNREVGRVTIPSLQSANFSVSVPGIVAGQSYRADFYADHNGNGRYDTPPTDHAWRLDLDNVTNDTVREFIHNTDFAAITWVYQFTLDAQNMTPHVGQLFEMRIVDAITNAEIGRASLERIPAANFKLSIPGLLLGRKYFVDFYADHNRNTYYDAPPTDHAWRQEITPQTGNLSLSFVHNTTFTNIQWVTTQPAGVIAQKPEDRLIINATLKRADGTPWSNIDIRFARSIAGRTPEYNWRGATDFQGVAIFPIIMPHDPLDKRGANGYYQIIAINRRTGLQVGQWNNVNINGNRLITLTLNIGGPAVVTNRQLLESTAFALTNQPNPFNPTTQISYQLPEMGDVSLVIYNTLGQKLRTLVQGIQAAGQYHIAWDGNDALGHAVSSGIYISRLEFKGQVQMNRMTLLK